MIEFAGTRSDEKYVVVEHYPRRMIPKRKYTVQSIPGRSGDLYFYEAEDAFENYDDTYTVFLDAKAPGLQEDSRGLAEWLLSPVGYQRLEDSYDPDTYRMAVYTGGEEFINVFNEYGRGSLKFNCAPKRFYKSGESEIVLTPNIPVYSPSSFKARPLYIVTTTGTSSVPRNISLFIRDNTQAVTRQFNINNVYGTITIDTERHTIRGSANFDANFVSGQYEDMYMGKSTQFGWSAYVSSVKVIPRWWTL